MIIRHYQMFHMTELCLMKLLIVFISRGGVKTIAPSQSVACDICFYDKQKDKVVIVSQNDWSIENCPASRYTPIGVVVVPGSHNVYNDGSCGVMSLKGMDCDNPLQGAATNKYMYWGVYGTDISSLPNLNQAPIGNQANGLPTGQTNAAYLPSNRFHSYQCLHDTDAYYYQTSRQAPSPYLTDGSRNPGYYQTTSPSSTNNCFADFDGKGNTDKIIAQRGIKDYSNWKPTYNTQADYPAASCCDMFYTEGTQQGDWYLPAMGELGYIMPPFKRINDAIANMRYAYGTSVGVALGSGANNYYWSSSEHGSGYARMVDTYNALVGEYGKSVRSYVRAFLRVGAEGVVSG